MAYSFITCKNNDFKNFSFFLLVFCVCERIVCVFLTVYGKLFKKKARKKLRDKNEHRKTGKQYNLLLVVISFFEPNKITNFSSFQFLFSFGFFFL